MMNSSTDKMKTEGNQWFSMNNVINSLNNVSLMPQAARGHENDIFVNPNPSPPKHRISPSQLELLENLGGCKVNLTTSQVLPPSQIGMGRGRVMKNLDKINVQERDAALSRVIRANKSSAYSNAAIENYFNNHSHSKSNEEEKSEDCVTSDEIRKSPDQTIVNSVLRPDAEVFHPTNLPSPDAEELSNCLVHLKDERESVASFCKNSMPPYSPRHFRYKPERTDNHIGFKTREAYIDSDEENCISLSNNVDESGYLNSITTYSSVSNSTSNSSISNVNGFSTLPIPRCSEEESKSTDVQPGNSNLDPNKEHRPKRIMKNALFSSLTSKQQDDDEPHHLMKPMDFNIGSASSAFHPVCSVKTNDHKLYDFQSDPSIDSETKDLINYLTSESSESSSTLSPLPKYSKKAKQSSGSRAYEPYTFNEQEFPPLS